MKKALITIPLATLAGLAIPTIAQAHNATATGTCQQGVSWSATAYDASVVNSITVTIDGTVRYTDPDFKASDTGTIATDKTTPHTWRVQVNAPGTQFDHDIQGSYLACVVPTTTVPATTTTIAATTTTVVPLTTTVPPAPPSDPTTTVVADDTPPAPCQYNPNIPADDPSCVAPTTTTEPPPSIASDVVAVEPALPRTGAGETVGVIILALCMITVGWFLARKGRRVS